jgi:MT0933-like antitoxin protein
MSLGDKFDEAKDKAVDEAGQHPDQVDKGIEKAGQFADDKTGGQHGDQIDKGEDALEKQVGKAGQN